MPNAIKPLGQFALTALSVLYSVPNAPTNRMTIIKSIWICNTDTAGRLVTLQFGPGPGLPGATNSLFESTPIPAKTTWYIDAADSALTMPAGSIISGGSDVAGKVIVTLSGEEIE